MGEAGQKVIRLLGQLGVKICSKQYKNKVSSKNLTQPNNNVFSSSLHCCPSLRNSTRNYAHIPVQPLINSRLAT